jgi:hypothetical protein
MATAMAMWLRAPIRAPRPLPRLPSADDASAEPASASRGAAKRRRVGDDGGADTDDAFFADVSARATTTASASSNPFTIAAGASTPVSFPRARRRLGAPPRLERGDYVLPDGASFLRYDPGALASVCTREAYDELWALSRDVPPTPNPLNRHTHIKRKQGTFGAAYKFGAQKSERLDGPQGVLGGRFENEDAWPFLVRACVDDARQPRRRRRVRRRLRPAQRGGARELVPGRHGRHGEAQRRRAQLGARRAHLLLQLPQRRSDEPRENV